MGESSLCLCRLFSLFFFFNIHHLSHSQGLLLNTEGKEKNKITCLSPFKETFSWPFYLRTSSVLMDQTLIMSLFRNFSLYFWEFHNTVSQCLETLWLFPTVSLLHLENYSHIHKAVISPLKLIIGPCPQAVHSSLSGIILWRRHLHSWGPAAACWGTCKSLQEAGDLPCSCGTPASLLICLLGRTVFLVTQEQPRRN